MPIKLYLDEDVDPLLARVLRDRGQDCVSTQEAGNLGHSDAEQLAFAVKQGRAILTFNIRDFVRLAQECAASGHRHDGIIVSDHLPFRDLLRRVLAMLADYGRKDLSGKLIWFQDYKEPR